MMKKLIILSFVLIFFSSCSSNSSVDTGESNVNLIGKNELDTLKDLVVRKMKYIMTSKEIDDLSFIKSKYELNRFLTVLWKQRDPTPQTDKNEYKEEYYSRIKTADTFFFERKPGSETERGRILLLYGRPDKIEKDNLPNGPTILNDCSIIKSYEIWVYNKPPGSYEIRENIFTNVYPGQMKFVFADMNGFGEFDLIFSTEKGERIDPRIYLIDNQY